MAEAVSGYSFKPDHLDIAGRKPGISAFMRIRNGEPFLEASIVSHLGHFDEIIAVHNQCTDQTAEILGRLEGQYPEKIKVYHYLDPVFPPGSDGHRTTPADDPRSLVNYCNFALSKTTRTIATKLDDDHLAMRGALADLIAQMARDPARAATYYAFSGLNLCYGHKEDLAVAGRDPVSGGGDIGFFTLRPDSYFTHDPRFERGPRKGFRRVFSGFVYWHLKYLKPGFGFANYDLAANPDSRYAARLKRIEALGLDPLSLPEIAARLSPRLTDRLAALFSDKKALILSRNDWVRRNWNAARLSDVIRNTTDPDSLAMVLAALETETP